MYSRAGNIYLGVFLLVVFSGAYFTKFFISPIYPLVALGLVMVVANILACRLKAAKELWFFSSLLTILFLVYFVKFLSDGALIQNALNFIIGPLIYVCVTISAMYLSKDKLEKISRLFVYFSLIVTAIECVYRILNPDFSFIDAGAINGKEFESLAFYAYKYNSLMYQDSNFVGLQLVVLLGFVISLQSYDIKFSYITYCLIFILIVLTLSRASIFAAGIIVFMSWFRNKKFVTKAIVVSMFFCVIVFVFLALNLKEDASFLSKFYILDLFYRYVLETDFNDLILGVGAGRSSGLIGIGAHNILVTYVIEAGLLFTLFISVFFLLMSWFVPGVMFMTLGWFVNGFSLTTFAVPYLYSSIAVLWVFYQKSKHRYV